MLFLFVLDFCALGGMFSWRPWPSEMHPSLRGLGRNGFTAGGGAEAETVLHRALQHAQGLCALTGPPSTSGRVRRETTVLERERERFSCFGADHKFSPLERYLGIRHC